MTTAITLHPHEAVTAIVAFFEHLRPENLPQIGQLYAANARFKDPFQDVQGVAAITGVFEHMFVALDAPRFVVTQRVVQGAQCFLTWDFHFRFQRFDRHVTQTVRGATHLVLDAQGRILLHRDYWDAAEELYEKIPLVGALMRWLKTRANS